MKTRITAGLLAVLLCNCSAPEEDPPVQLPLRNWTNSIGMEFIEIPAGKFSMGSNKSDRFASLGETPQHRVTLSQPFLLGKYEVTQQQWEAVMGKGNNPSEVKAPNNPVGNVSWDDAQEFIRYLNEKEGTDKYRLPTEAEWEYAARAGTKTLFSFGGNIEDAASYGWFDENSLNENGTVQAHPVGQKRPNPWGLHDMHGNVTEWVQDWFEEKYYANSPPVDPAGPIEEPKMTCMSSFSVCAYGAYRVRRGGSFAMEATGMRSGARHSSRGDGTHATFGFRVAASPGHLDK